jgi:hypothetical protein
MRILGHFSPAEHFIGGNAEECGKLDNDFYCVIVMTS